MDDETRKEIRMIARGAAAALLMSSAALGLVIHWLYVTGHLFG